MHDAGAEAVRQRLFVALDTTSLERAAGLFGALAGAVGGFKVGKEFFTAQGPAGVRAALGVERTA